MGPAAAAAATERLKAAVVEPCGIVTDAGTVTSLLDELSITVTPGAAAGAGRITLLAGDDCPGASALGIRFKVNALTFAGGVVSWFWEV